MSALQKLRGGSNSEITKLKALWGTLAEPARDFWRALFSSDTTQAQIRAQLLTKLKINLTRDNQLTDFRQWLLEQDLREQEAERQTADEAQIISDHPDWSLDQAREETLKRSYFRALSRGDFKLGLATVKQDLNTKKISVDERKMALLEKKAAQAEATDKVLSDAELSPEQREQRIKEIYGRS
jgi:hypothetical protein